jgi:hypothetical protein
MVSPKTIAMVCGCLFLFGCGGRSYEVAPVSGRVTIQGKSAAGVHVSFQPVAEDKDDIMPGPGSYAETDESGAYTLQTVEPTEPGAVVGTHRVRFTLLAENPEDVRDDVGLPIKRQLPERYGDGSMTFEVPPGGTDKADFELQMD